MLALLDVLPGGAALVIEPNHPVWFHRQVGDNETHTGEQLTRVPFDPGDDAALLVPGRRLIVEIHEEPLHPGPGGPPHGPHQPMRDLFPEPVFAGSRMA